MTHISSTQASPWVVRPRPNTAARIRLFCLAHAGGGANTYRSWLTELPPDVELCNVQLPGRETRWREAPLTSVEPVVRELLEGLAPLLDRPYALFGHSLGALVAYELTRAIRRAGLRAPLHLFASAHRAPHRPRRHSLIGHLSDDAFIDEIGRRYGGVPQAVLESPELLALTLPALRADLNIFETYAHTADLPLPCPITALGGTDDVAVLREELLDWAQHTSGGFAFHHLPGDHFYLQACRSAVVAIVKNGIAGAAATTEGALA